MALPLIGAFFAILTALDIASYALTGDDISYHVASWLGWLPEVNPGDNVVLVWGMSAADFFVQNAVYLFALLAVTCLVWWYATRPLKECAKK